MAESAPGALKRLPHNGYKHLNIKNMKFIVSSSDLLKGVLDVSKAIPAKPVLQILEDFLFELEGGTLKITASDTELTLRTEIEVENGIEDGRMTVTAKHIIDLLKELPDQPITITQVSDCTFKCEWSGGESTLPYRSADDYPEIKGTGELVSTINFPAATLVEAISSTIYATADDEIRPAMNGIFFDIDTESTTLVASDAHKLICYTADNVKAEEKASFILHKKPAGILKTIIGKDVENVEITFDNNNAVFRFDKTEVICRLIVGKYPKYRSVIPQNNFNVLKIDRFRFLNTIRRISVCANRASNHVKFDLKPGSIEISAQDLGFSLSARETIPCDYEGEELTVGFKSPFMIEILSNFTGEEVIMKFLDNKMAALIMPADQEKEKICGIIMPIMIA